MLQGPQSGHSSAAHPGLCFTERVYFCNPETRSGQMLHESGMLACDTARTTSKQGRVILVVRHVDRLVSSIFHSCISIAFKSH